MYVIMYNIYNVSNVWMCTVCHIRNSRLVIRMFVKKKERGYYLDTNAITDLDSKVL